MPDCSPFQLYVGESLEALTPLLLAEMRRRGATVSGTGDSGAFTIPLPIGGSIRGTYRVAGKSLAVEIKSRPTMVSCGMIESKLQDFILDTKAIMKSNKT